MPGQVSITTGPAAGKIPRGAAPPGCATGAAARLRACRPLSSDRSASASWDSLACLRQLPSRAPNAAASFVIPEGLFISLKTIAEEEKTDDGCQHLTVFVGRRAVPTAFLG